MFKILCRFGFHDFEQIKEYGFEVCMVKCRRCKIMGFFNKSSGVFIKENNSNERY